MIRVVIDTSALVSAVLQGRLRPYVTPVVLEEYIKVLKRAIEASGHWFHFTRTTPENQFKNRSFTSPTRSTVRFRGTTARECFRGEEGGY